MVAGLGIHFDNPSTARAPTGATPVSSARHGKPLVTPLSVDSLHPHQSNTTADPSIHRVRIVSGQNKYHIISPLIEPNGQGKDGASGIGDEEEYDDDYSILDVYGSSQSRGDRSPVIHIDDADALSPISSIYTETPSTSAAMSMRSLSAVSSGSSTRHKDVHAMGDPPRSYASTAAEAFESQLRAEECSSSPTDDIEAELRAGLPPKTDAYTALYPEAPPPMHTRSYSVDDAGTDQSQQHLQINGYPTQARDFALPAITRTHSDQPYAPPQPVPTFKSALKRTSAMSRPKSMLELNQLYAMQTLHKQQQQQQEPHSAARKQTSDISYSHYYDLVGMPGPPGMSRTSTATSAVSPSSISTEDSHGTRSTAASSTHGSTEAKPTSVFVNQLMPYMHRALPNLPTATPPHSASSHHLVKARSAISMRSLATGSNNEHDYIAQLRSPVASRESGRVTPNTRLHIRNRAMSVASARVSVAMTETISSGLRQAQEQLTQQSSSTLQNLQRQSTLLTATGNSARRAKDLQRLLDPKLSQSRTAYSPTPQSFNSAEIPAQPVFQTTFDPVGAMGPSGHIGQTAGGQLRRKHSNVVLEQAVKGKARAELDLLLASSLVVEGGTLRGRLEMRVRKERANEGEVWLGAVKVRIVGFEELGGEEARHVFYHHSACIESFCGKDGNKDRLPCYASAMDAEGFCKGKIGTHTFPFEMHLPVSKGAKGSMKCKQGVVKYIVIGSVKLKSQQGADRSIAHFYRHVDVFPYLNPAIVLAPAARPVQAECSKALFLGCSGKVNLSASLHRSTWIAGQRCYIEINIRNESSKKIKVLSVSLVRALSIFKGQATIAFDEGEEMTSGGQTQCVRKKVAESILEMGKKGTKGSVTAKGAWLGVDKGEEIDVQHLLMIPAEELSIERGRFLEVSYTLRVTISGSIASELGVDLPVRIINFVSVDPPPGHIAPPLLTNVPAGKSIARSWSTDQLRMPSRDSDAQVVAPAPARMASMESLSVNDLNRMYSRPNIARGESYDTYTSRQSGSSAQSGSSSGMSRAYTTSELDSICEVQEPEPSRTAHAQIPEQVVRARERQVRHQMSLDCIGSAIASATARRYIDERQRYMAPADESFENGEYLDGDGDVTLQEAHQEQAYQTHNVSADHPMQIQLDDLDEIPDDFESLSAQHKYLPSEAAYDHQVVYLDEEDESEDEVDMVLHAKQFESEEDDEAARSVVAFGSAVPLSPAQQRRSQLRPVSPAGAVSASHKTICTRSMGSTTSPTNTTRRLPQPSSPVTSKISRIPEQSSSTSESAPFALATPASPIKKGRASIVGTSSSAITSTPQRPTRLTQISTRRSPNPTTSLSPVATRNRPRPASVIVAPVAAPVNVNSPARPLTASTVRKRVSLLDASQTSIMANLGKQHKSSIRKIASSQSMGRTGSISSAISSAASCSTGRISPSSIYSSQ